MVRNKSELSGKKYVTISDVNPETLYSGYSHVAHQHYWAAEILRDRALKYAEINKHDHSVLTFSVICLYHASLDCYLNETLAGSASRLEKSNPDQARRCFGIQKESLNPGKISKFLEAYGAHNKIGDEIREHLDAFLLLRNVLYHHSPETRPFNEIPADAEKALKLSAGPVINTSWAALCGHLQVLEWSRKSLRDFLDELNRALQLPSLFSDLSFLGWDHHNRHLQRD